MAWDFLKKLVGNREDAAKAAATPPPPRKTEVSQPLPAAGVKHPAVESKPAASTVQQAGGKEKSPAEKTDEELAEELDKMSPQILAQAKAPQQRSLIIGIYRKMLIAKIDINDDKEVKKWMQKHPEVLQGGDPVKIETVRREEPKVGRNDPCPCGSGKKHKKCCGAR